MLGVQRYRRPPTPYGMALDRCDDRSLNMLLQSGNRIPEVTTAGVTVLMRVSQHCGQAIVSRLAKSQSLDQSDSQGRKALWYAANAANAEAIKTLLSFGARAARADETGETALVRAAARGSVDAVLALLPSSGDINRQTLLGNTALIVAAGSGSETVVGALVQARAKLDLRNALGDSALMVAAREGYAEIVKTLVAAGGIRVCGTRSEKRHMILHWPQARASWHSC